MDTDKDATYKFTKEEAEEMRAAHERIEKKIDDQNKLLEHLVRRGDWWKTFIRNIVRRFSGVIESELKEVIESKLKEVE